MSKKNKNAKLEEALWIVDYIDLMNASDCFSSDPMPLDQATEKYNQLTENGTVQTPNDKTALGYYNLRQAGR